MRSEVLPQPWAYWGLPRSQQGFLPLGPALDTMSVVGKLAEKFFYDFSLYKMYFNKSLSYDQYVAV